MINNFSRMEPGVQASNQVRIDSHRHRVAFFVSADACACECDAIVDVLRTRAITGDEAHWCIRLRIACCYIVHPDALLHELAATPTMETTTHSAGDGVNKK